MISVIVPLYKVERYIGDCITSILNQTCRDFEIVLIDDGSPDRSAEIAEELLCAGDIPYRLISTENRGVSAARNTGIQAAAGDYLIMVDADDVLSPGFIADFVRLQEEHPGLSMYSCGFQVVPNAFAGQWNTDKYREQLFLRDEAQTLFLSRKIKFLLPALMFDRAFLTDNGILFDEQVRYSEDIQFIWRCLAYNSASLCHLYKRNYYYILHPQSTMTASGVSKILTGCGGAQRLYTDISDLLTNDVRTAFLPKWYFAMLHGAAKMLSYADFLNLYNRVRSEANLAVLTKDNSKKTAFVIHGLLLSRLVGYALMRLF